MAQIETSAGGLVSSVRGATTAGRNGTGRTRFMLLVTALVSLSFVGMIALLLSAAG